MNDSPPHTGQPVTDAGVTEPQEVELKLAVPANAVERLRRHPRLRELAARRPSTQTLRSVYYDTAQHDLANAGMGLRLRGGGRTRIQTLKTRGSNEGALHRRGEYEARTRGETPDLELVTDPALRERLHSLLGDKPLQPVFETEFRRTRRLLRHDGAEWTCDLDLGEVRTAERSEPLCELELELRDGEPAPLFDLALDLLDSVELRPCTLSKAGRGYALLNGTRPQPQRAPPIALERGATLEQALAGIVRACLEQISVNAAPAVLGIDPEGVHQMRVGVRRLRSALATFASVLPPAQTAALRDELRWLAAELGGARDLDVFDEQLLAPLLARGDGPPGLERLHEETRSLRADRQRAVRAAVDSSRYTRLVLLLGRWLARSQWREQALTESAARLFLPAEEYASQALAKHYRKAGRLARGIRRAPAAQRHELRIRLKKLRYTAEFFGSLYRARRTRRFLAPLRSVLDDLGYLNDVATADQVLGDLLSRPGDFGGEAERAAGFVQGWVAHEAARQLEDLGKRWRVFARTPVFWHT